MADGVDNGISGGNDREDRIAKFMREAPRAATTLLLTGDTNGQSDGVVLSTWGKELWSEQLAALVNTELEAQHEMADVVDSYYWLIFVGDDPNDVRATRRKRFNVRTRKALTTMGDNGLPNLAIDGSAATQATLNQTILFKMVSLYSTNLQALLNAQTTTITKLTELYTSSKSDEAQARSDLHELKEIVIEMQAQWQADNSNGEMTEAQKAWFDLASKATSSAELQRLVDGVSRFLLAKFGT